MASDCVNIVEKRRGFSGSTTAEMVTPPVQQDTG